MYGSTSKAGGLLLGLAVSALLLAGCGSSGGDDADSTTTEAAAATTTTAAEATTTTAAEDETTTTEGSSSSDLPTYEDAKRVYLAQADDATKASCDEDQEDKELSVSSGSYIRLICGGMERFEYIEGAENYEENWPTIESEAVYRSVFQVPDELIVVPSGSNEDFAPALADDCGCGEVIEQTG